MKPNTTRTIGPLHLEDLEPHRFEDLIRQLAYDFRTWQRLEATGRGGSDDGFDARALEVSPRAEAAASGETDGDDDDNSAPSEARQWLFQCKREKTIHPKKLAGYLDGLPDEDLYGVIFACACDFSKAARDIFLDKCRIRGISEAHLWGKAEIEDALFQPKNDHLLFAYFGFSLQTRRRSIQSTLRATLATKRRLKRVLESSSSSIIVIRNAADSEYPSKPDRPTNAAPTWFVVPGGTITHEGLRVEYSSYHAYLSDDALCWDAANAMGLHRTWFYAGRWRFASETDPRATDVDALWNSWPDRNRGWLRNDALIPYERILGIDDSGDQYFTGPQLYVEYDARGPFEAWYSIYVQNIESFGATRLYIEEGTRIEVFPANCRREI